MFFIIIFHFDKVLLIYTKIFINVYINAIIEKLLKILTCLTYLKSKVLFHFILNIFNSIHTIKFYLNRKILI